MRRLAWTLALVAACGGSDDLEHHTPALPGAHDDVVAGELVHPRTADAGQLVPVSTPVPHEDPIDEPAEEPIDEPADEPVAIGAMCFAEIADDELPGPNYDQFGPTVGSHCAGTNHQDITGVERVVFVGDSVTVGTPPTEAGDFYRSVLAERLAERFGLEAPNALWQLPNPLEGTALVREAGDFASCAKWGARTDDLVRDNSQLEDCLPESERGKRTLVVMTMGGNDISSITQDGPSQTLEETRAQVEEFVGLMRDAVLWLTEPGRFPNGVFVVFANMYEFTDGTGDLGSCAGAQLAGMGQEWDDVGALADLVIWANEQYVSIAVETGTDVIFLLEHFCGHGFHHDDPDGRCYRGPGAELWFDLTCIHPNALGHQAIADLFYSVIAE